MFEEGMNVYYVDFNGVLNQGLVKSYGRNYVWVRKNECMSIRVEPERVGLSEKEAFEKFELWKVKYKKDLLQDNNWLKEIFEAWRFGNDDITPKEMSKIMLDVIAEKTDINIEED